MAAAESTGADRATVCALNRSDPRTASVVAGHRTEELVGKHFAIDEGKMRDVFISGEPVACDDCLDFGVHYDRGAGRAGGAAPIRWDGEVRGALAVVGKPDLVLADEPTAALDEEASERVMRLLLNIHRFGTTVLIATSNRNLAALGGSSDFRLSGGTLAEPGMAA